jgi:hypothetical protein
MIFDTFTSRSWARPITASPALGPPWKTINLECLLGGIDLTPALLRLVRTAHDVEIHDLPLDRVGEAFGRYCGLLPHGCNGRRLRARKRRRQPDQHCWRQALERSAQNTSAIFNLILGIRIV